MANNYEYLINELSHSEALVDVEQPISINVLTRQCELPEKFNKQIGVIGDHKSNLVTFQCDRYIDGHDISACTKAFVKWNNVGAKTTGAYMIKDRTVLEEDENKIQFHWEVESDCTTASGALEFQICFLDYNNEGTIVTYRWNSNPNSQLSIGKGMFDPDIDGLEPAASGSFIYSGEISIT